MSEWHSFLIYAITGTIALVACVHWSKRGSGWSIADVVCAALVGPSLGWVMVAIFVVLVGLFTDAWSKPRWFKDTP
jgi:hypothetical protein